MGEEMTGAVMFRTSSSGTACEMQQVYKATLTLLLSEHFDVKLAGKVNTTIGK